MTFEIMNIVDDDTGDILCEGCQETIQQGMDDIVLDFDLLYHKICFEDHVQHSLEMWEKSLVTKEVES